MEEKFVVVLAVGLTIFGLFLITAQEFNFVTDTPEEKTFVTQSFGEVGQATTDLRTVNFGDFDIGEGRGDVTVYQSFDETFESHLIRSTDTKFQYNATQPTGGEITFEVLGKEGNGAIYVEVNGNRIFEEKMIATAETTIPIQERHLRPGQNNFKIGTTRGSFFSPTTYRIEDLKVEIDDRVFNDKVDTFRIYDYELQNFVTSNLTFTIPPDTAIIEQPLEIYINDNKLYEQETPRSQQTIEVNPQNADLNTGMNTIRFKTDTDAHYTLENTQLALRYRGPAQQANQQVNFNLTQNELNYIQREDTTQTVTFNYQNMLPTNRQMEINLNNHEIDIMPNSGRNSVEFRNDAFQTQNQLQLKSDGAFILNDLNVKATKN